MQLTSKKDRFQIVVHVLLASLLFVLVLTYNSAYYNVLNRVRLKIFKFNKQNTSIGTNTKNLETTAPPTVTLPNGYLVWNENCHMQSFDPFSSEYLAGKEEDLDRIREEDLNCTERTPLVTKMFNKTLESYILHIDLDLKNEYLNDTDDEIACCYIDIYRDGDSGYTWTDCMPMEQDFIVLNSIEYMLVECNGTRNASVFYQDGFSFIQERTGVTEKLENNTNTEKPFGILLFGIDSVSQFNLRRVMPELFQYLQNNSWLELSGYNKIDDNTFPNLMAIFTGLNLEKSDEICHYHEPGGIDNCSTLFNFFNQQGLITAYSEDACDMSTFDYLKPGFVKPPTDYYQRPLLLAIEERLPFKKLSGLKYCIGPRRYGEYVYDFGVEFAERFLGKSIFGLFWTNTFSHNDWIDPSTMDERMIEYFNYMDDKGILENNVIILFSDHGARWGFLRNQKEGYIEERLPMFFIRLPQWFKNEHPAIVDALTLNKNRLTSPYDVHVTLKHLALMSLGKSDAIDLPISCPSCQTLLTPVLENRTCELAGIDEHWCTCIPYEALDRSSEKMENLTKLVIDEMNTYLNESGHGDKCAPLIFKRNVEANLELDLHQDAHNFSIQTYRMNFETNPNEAAFDATFLYDNINNNITIDVTEISRLNSYAKDAVCIDDNILKKYCICNESVKKEEQNR